MPGTVRKRIERREGESLPLYRSRLAEIEAIVEGFRWGRYELQEAERAEARLAELLSADPRAGHEDG